MVDWLKWHLNHYKYGKQPWAVQMEAMRQAGGRNKYGFWLEQGLGKTALTLNEWVNSGLETLVIVVPQSFKLGWTTAPAEWGLVDVHAGYWPRHPLPVPGRRSVYAVNYEAIRVGASGFEALTAFLTKNPSFLVFDETSSIANFESLTAKGAIQLAQCAPFVRGLNGTPLTKNATDYFAQLRILGGLNGYNPYAFKTKYCIKGGYMGRQIVGIRHEDQLTEILNKHAFRALKADWRKDLPPQIWHEPTLVEMTPGQYRHYNNMLAEFGTEINGREISVSLALNQAAKLQQISSGILTQGDITEVVVPFAQNPKILAVKDIYESGRGKMVVVYYYRESGNQLMKALTSCKLNPAYFQGGIPLEQQAAEKHRFNNDPTCRAIVAQQVAACRGHDFLGGSGEDRCNKMVYYENSYALLHRLQMNDRIHRGEQDQPCDYFDLCASPVDLVPIEALRNKKNVADYMDRLVLALQGPEGAYSKFPNLTRPAGCA